MTLAHALTSERRKLCTLRLPRAAVLVTAAVSALAAFVNVDRLAARQRVDVVTVALAPLALTWFVVAVVATLASTAEFQHRTVVTSLLWTPRRGDLLVAKGLVAAGYGALLTLLGIVSAAAAGMATSAVEHLPLHMGPAEGWTGLLAAVAVGGLLGVLSSALGLLTRSSALALTALLIWKFALEGVLPVVARRPELAAWMPTNVANALIDPSKPGLSTGLCALLLLLYVAAAAVPAWLRFVRDDA